MSSFDSTEFLPPQQDQEVWKDIPGWEGLYQASSLGKIRSLERIRKHLHGTTLTIPGRILKPGDSQTGKGYYTVCLSFRNKSKTHRVARLVAMAFIPNPDDKPEVNHKDANTKNDKVSNLEWCTHKENIDHASKTVPHGTMITYNNKTMNMTAWAKEFGVSLPYFCTRISIQKWTMEDFINRTTRRK